MKKSLILAFGLIIAATAAYSIPNDFKELKVKPVIEKVFSVDQETPVLIVDEITTVAQASIGNLCSFNYEMIKNEEVKINMQPGYRWRRLSISSLNKHVDKAIHIKFINRKIHPLRTE